MVRISTSRYFQNSFHDPSVKLLEFDLGLFQKQRNCKVGNPNSNRQFSSNFVSRFPIPTYDLWATKAWFTGIWSKNAMKLQVEILNSLSVEKYLYHCIDLSAWIRLMIHYTLLAFYTWWGSQLIPPNGEWSTGIITTIIIMWHLNAIQLALALLMITFKISQRSIGLL